MIAETKELEICWMRPEWLPQALDVYQWYVSNSTATFQISPATLKEMEQLLFFEDGRYRSFAAFSGGRFAGYGILTRYKAREAFNLTAEVTVYLDASYCGKGIGRKMVDIIEAHARDQGFHALIAQICGENTSSCALFERSGYLQCSRYREVGYKFDRWLDLVCYQKIL